MTRAVQVSASRASNGLLGGQPDHAKTLRQRRIQLANPVLLGWRRFIDKTTADAKKTRHGLPTGDAIAARWWIAEYKPDRQDRTRLGMMLYAGCFESCCEQLGLDVETERKQRLAEIDDSLVQQIVRHAGDQVYEMRARVLSCAGVPTAVGRQFALALVHPDDYEDVAEPEQARAVAAAVRRENRARAKAIARRKKRLKAAELDQTTALLASTDEVTVSVAAIPAATPSAQG